MGKGNGEGRGVGEMVKMCNGRIGEFGLGEWGEELVYEEVEVEGLLRKRRRLLEEGGRLARIL